MKYCVSFTKNFKYINEVDEFNIVFENLYEQLLYFISQYKNKRINILIKDEESFVKDNAVETLMKIKEENPELKLFLQLDSVESKILPLIKERGLKCDYFFSTIAADWDTFYGLLGFFPCDIFVGGNLGFDIINVSEIAHDAGIRVRVYPNIAQSSWRYISSLYKFFIRPDDTHLYETFVDVFDLTQSNIQKQETYFKIYAIDKKWYGTLDEIIINFNEKIDSKYLPFFFANRRLSCGKKCMMGRPCNICGEANKIAEELKKHDIKPNILNSFFEKELKN